VGFWFFTTQFLQGVLGYSPLQAGLAFLPTTLPNFASAMLVPRLTRKLGHTGLLGAGLALGVVGLAWLGQASAQSSYLTGVALPMVLIGLGQGAVLAPLTVAAVAGVAREDAGAASGMVNVAHQLGGSLGLAVLVVVFAGAHPSSAAGPAVLAHGIAAAIDAGAVMLAAALLIVVFFIVPRRAPRQAIALRDPAPPSPAWRIAGSQSGARHAGTRDAAAGAPARCAIGRHSASTTYTLRIGDSMSHTPVVFGGKYTVSPASIRSGCPPVGVKVQRPARMCIASPSATWRS
jgi:MFS family permease